MKQLDEMARMARDVPDEPETHTYWRAGYREGFRKGLDTILGHLFGTWHELLAHNLATGAALCRAYELGHASCWCDQGPIGSEWHPGMGCTPESIADRRWNDDPHGFIDGGSGECSACGRTEQWFLHEQCPECFAIPRECDGEHHDGCSTLTGAK